tara:strand:+ start:18259 stop:18525 length:267 start_codon:yes stop_codon:yes gene_type:complete
MEKVQHTLKLIKTADHTIFNVEYIKKDGTLRKMPSARLYVKKDTNGKGMKYNAIQKGLLPVWDMRKNGWRTVNLDTVTKLKVKKKQLI